MAYLPKYARTSKQKKGIIVARYPKAVWKPIKANYTARVTLKNCVILHTSASAGATSLYGWFSNPRANASSHFHVANDGTVEQYVDTAHMSWANKNGNSRSVTIETQGDGTKPWTAKQRQALIELVRWICKTHGIPVRQMESSSSSQKGIGWHRLGCDGNFPKSGILRGRNQRGGGESWSSAYGKVCPGDDRILQVPDMIKEIAGEAVKPAGKPSKPADKPKPKPSKVPDQSPKNTPNGSTTFPENYADLTVNGNFKSWEIGALQILLHNLGFRENKQWDGKFEKLTVKDTMNLMRRNGYYHKTPFTAKGVAKGTPLAVDGKAGYWFWVEFQRMLGDDEGNRGKSYYDLKKFKLDGKPETETGKAIQRWLNDNN